MKAQKSIERLIIYKELLEAAKAEGIDSIYSHQLAEKAALTPAQIRRDLMLVGYAGSAKNGYNINKLIFAIKELLEPKEGISMVIVGVGNLGKAIMNYFLNQRPNFRIIAGFDNDPNKVNRVIAGVRCYALSEINEVLKNQQAQIAIIAVPSVEAQNTAEKLIEAGILGLVNFAPTILKVPEKVNVEYMDMKLAFIKAAYFSRMNKDN